MAETHRELHVRGVITGCVNAFCLICECFFENMGEAHSHINTSVHWKNIELFPYMAKFQNQNIRKVKAGYFCESCNMLLLTAMKVGRHILEDSHKHNWATMSLKPFERGIMAFDNVHVQARAWHGIIDDVCLLCDADVNDINQHMQDNTHVLNLIQKTVKFGANDAIYRQTDEKTVQCLTCNELVTLNLTDKHFRDDHHLDRYAKCKIDNNNVSIKPVSKADKDETKEAENDQNIPENLIIYLMDQIGINEDKPDIKIDKPDIKEDKPDIKEDKQKISKELNVSQILSSLATYRANDIDINFETDTAYCRKCCVSTQFDYNDIEIHIKEHSNIKRSQSARYPAGADKYTYCPKLQAYEMLPDAISDHNVASKYSKIPRIDSASSKQNGQDSNSDDDSASTSKIDESDLETNNGKCDIVDAKQFARENNLTFKENHNNAFCRMCRVKLPSSIKSMKEHVRGATHTKNKSTYDKLQTKTLSKQTMKGFIFRVDSLLELYPEDCLVNGRYFMNQLSFSLITENVRGLRCLLCEINMHYPPPFHKMEVQAHVDSFLHHRRMEMVAVITSDPSEFIREIRPDTFHCGFCNLVLSTWSGMENHLKCTDHIKKKDVQIARARRELTAQVLTHTQSPFFL